MNNNSLQESSSLKRKRTGCRVCLIVLAVILIPSDRKSVV